METTLAPAQVSLNSDCNILKADGCDVAVIRVAIKDAKGIVVPTADNLVKFSIEGPGKIIGTVILSFNNKPVDNLHDLLEARMSVIGTNTEVVIFRNQKEGEKRIELERTK